jgi:hypothetical protein
MSLTVNATTTGDLVYFNNSANCNINNVTCKFAWFDTTVLANPVPGEKVLVTFYIST